MLRLFRSLSRFETQDIKTQPQFNHYLIPYVWGWDYVLIGPFFLEAVRFQTNKDNFWRPLTRARDRKRIRWRLDQWLVEGCRSYLFQVTVADGSKEMWKIITTISHKDHLKERENKTLDFQLTNLKRGKGSQGRHSLRQVVLFIIVNLPAWLEPWIRYLQRERLQGCLPHRLSSNGLFFGQPVVLLIRCFPVGSWIH